MNKIINQILQPILSLFTKTKKLKAIGNGTQLWYGRVNSWCSDKSSSRSDLEKDMGLNIDGYMIEMLSYGTHTANVIVGTLTQAQINKIDKEYKWLVNECRNRGLWLFVSITNDNAGKGGNSLWRLEQQESNNQTCSKLLEIVLKNGPKNVVVQPVAETQTTFGTNWDRQAGQRLNAAGFKTVYNGSGRPASNPWGATYLAAHPASISTRVPAGQLNISDHSTLLREIGAFDTKLNVSKCQQYYDACKSYGNPVCGVYHLIMPSHDNSINKVK